MSNNNRRRIIRILVATMDFIVVNAVIWLYYKDLIAQAPIMLFIVTCANVALAIAEMFFSTLIYSHYVSIDKVMRQVCLLAVTFGLIFLALVECCHSLWIVDIPNIDITLLAIIYITVPLLGSRIVEFIVLKYLRIVGRNTRALLFVGDSAAIESAYNEIDINSYHGLKVLGYYGNDDMSPKMREKIPYLGSLDDLLARLDSDPKRLAHEVYCTDIPLGRAFITRLVDYTIRHGIQFNYIPPHLVDFGYCLKPRTEGGLVVFSNLNEPLLSSGNRIIKRTFDLVVSTLGIVCMLPFIPIIGGIIKLSSPGPIFFKQKRTGLNGQDFNMIKFRSMHVNRDADNRQATANDPRKFAFGNFMRRTNIDELPQLFNVFMGDMSIVGPRPHMLAHTDEYRKKIYEYMLRHLVRPGITGWAQVTGFRGATPELWQMRGRVEKDLWYIQNWSFWLDIRIIMRTLLLTLRHDENAY